MQYVRYFKATGKIDSWGSTEPHMLQYYQDDDMGAVEVSDIPIDQYPLWWVKDGVAVLRAQSPITISKITIKADGKDAAVALGLPDPCTMIINGQATTITGGEATFTSDRPLSLDLSVDQFPFIAWSATITAVLP